MKQCKGCIEKDKRIKELLSMLKRGVKVINRLEWEPGETDQEWYFKASQLIMQYKLDTKQSY